MICFVGYIELPTELRSHVTRGESPGDPCYKVGESHLADSQTYVLLVT